MINFEVRCEFYRDIGYSKRDAEDMAWYDVIEEKKHHDAMEKEYYDAMEREHYLGIEYDALMGPAVWQNNVGRHER